MISGAIAHFSLWMLYATYVSGRVPMQSGLTDEKLNAAELKAKSEAYGRQKDLLLHVLSLLGTVTGYYLGRVPAEQRAQQAQQSANVAQGQLASANEAVVKASSASLQATQKMEHQRKETVGALSRVLPLLARSKN